MNGGNFIILLLHQFWLIGDVHTRTLVLARARVCPATSASPYARPSACWHLCVSGDELPIKKTGCIVHGCFGCGPGPGVALPQPELWTSVHQDGAPDNRPPGRRGRDPGGLALAEALLEEGHAPYPQAQPCGECADGRRAGANDSEAGRAQEAINLRHDGAGPW